MSAITAFVDELRDLTSVALVQKIEQLAARERRNVAWLIAHLSEISRRKLHLELGYRNLFDYCVRGLRLSEGCTALRIQVSNVCREFPLLLDALGQGRVSLTVAGKLAPWLTAGNCEILLTKCEGMTKREVEEHLVKIAPRPVVSSGTRRQAAAPRMASVSSEAPASADALFASGHDAVKTRAVDRTPLRRGTVEPCRPEVYNVRFSVNKEFMDKLERAAEVSGVGNAHGNIAEVLEKAMDVFLEKKDPQKRQQRREKREARNSQKTIESSSQPGSAAIDGTDSPKRSRRSRHISLPLRDRLLARAGHRCEYVSKEGLRCTERTRLAVDHREPWGRGGSSDESNLRVLCEQHNLLAAERCYGVEFMEQRIAAAHEQTHRRRKSASSPPCLGEVGCRWSTEPLHDRW